MNNLFRGLIAGFGAWKLGGGCFGTIIVFILIWVALGQCSNTSTTALHEKEQRVAEQNAMLIQKFEYKTTRKYSSFKNSRMPE